MKDFSVFDSLIDSVFVIDEDRHIRYCNNAAASLCDSSVRRLSRGSMYFYEVIRINDESLFVNVRGTRGQHEPVPLTELDYQILKSGRVGKTQLLMQPFSSEFENLWVVILHDVTLEETLHVKYQGELQAKEVVIEELERAREQLEAYSKNLEQMVEERTLEVKRANLLLQATMNSLGQGFVIFGPQGVCESLYTKACEEILEGTPAGRPLWEVLRLEEDQSTSFKNWLQVAFAESLPFESLRDLAPSAYAHSQGRHIVLDYYPIRSEGGKISQLVLVATDKTAEIESQRQLEREKNRVQMVSKLIKSKEQFLGFIESTKIEIDHLRKNAQQNFSEDMSSRETSEVYRKLHTLEGEAGAFFIEELRQAARQLQHRLNEEGQLSPQDYDLLEESLEAFLASHRDLLRSLGLVGVKKVAIAQEDLEAFAQDLQAFGASSELALSFEKHFIHRPLEEMMSHLEDLAHNVAEKLGKELEPIQFQMQGVKVHPERFKNLIATLVHVFRNAVDHGIESPEEREMCGKSRAGRIEVQGEVFLQDGQSWLRLKILDDGQGINPERIRAKLEKIQGKSHWSQLSDERLIQYIFDPGFSSRDSIGEWSGRGIGLDALKAEVTQMNGRVWVESSPGQGAEMTLEVPLGLSYPTNQKVA